MSNRHISAADKRTKAMIAACVESGAGIDYLPDAPNFRYEPRTDRELGLTSFKGREDCGPSKRGSLTCGRHWRLKNFSASKLSADPMYSVAMAGDEPALTKARERWHMGNPEPLRAYLEAQKCEREYELQKLQLAA